MAFTLNGKIVTKRPGKLTVQQEQNMIFEVLYSSKTTILRADGSAGSDADLRVGITVHVAGDLTEQGDVIAKKIEIDAGAPKKP